MVKGPSRICLRLAASIDNSVRGSELLCGPVLLRVSSAGDFADGRMIVVDGDTQATV